MTIDEAKDPVGPQAHRRGKRCSDKGFLAMSTMSYLELLDWAARNSIANKRGTTPPEVPSIFARLKIDPAAFAEQVKDFGRMFSHVAGKPRTVSEARSKKTHRRFYLRRIDRELQSASP